MLELKNITKIYNPGEITEACLFRDFNLSVEAGEFVSIVGSNGSGKTSLLNIICGSIPIQGGDVIIDGESMLHKKEFVRYRRFVNALRCGWAFPSGAVPPLPVRLPLSRL